MAAPPRMLLLSGGGTEAFVLMPTTFDVSLFFTSPSQLGNYTLQEGSKADIDRKP
jgi:hypothetical protein